MKTKMSKKMKKEQKELFEQSEEAKVEIVETKEEVLKDPYPELMQLANFMDEQIQKLEEIKKEINEPDEKQKVERTKLESFLKMLNAEPPSQMIRKNKYAGNSNYLPIDYVEMTLDRIYLGRWNFMITRLEIHGNIVLCTCELTVINPVTGEKKIVHGASSRDMIVEPSGYFKPKTSEKGVPAAVSFAKKNAASQLGKVFGRDLNRTAEISYQKMYTPKKKVNKNLAPLNEIMNPENKNNDEK